MNSYLSCYHEHLSLSQGALQSAAGSIDKHIDFLYDVAMLHVVILISGRGSNMRSLVERARHYRVVAVVSNKAEAPGLVFARERGIETVVVPREHYASLTAQKEALLSAVKTFHPSLVALAGYMQIIAPNFIAAFSQRIVNIHPSLLPKYPGLDTHARAIAGGESEHGCTVHLVDEGVDTGIMLAQAPCACSSRDTVPELSDRVLEREHVLYPWVLNNIASGDITIGTGIVRYSESAQREAAAKGFRLNMSKDGEAL
ncbi:MAG: phosphoribosylglycinamide formyltransferase [Bdellovibrionota bacterium]|nr:MAG: phosphoribosylglycinamide formyltransferase [Bdellovibrionota bacterium]